MGLQASRTIAALTGLIGALALLAGSAGSANKTPSLAGVGFADTDIMADPFDLPGEAAAAADRDLQAGADTISVRFSVTANVGRIALESLRPLCTAAGLASAKHFDLLARVEIRKADGNFGF